MQERKSDILQKHVITVICSLTAGGVAWICLSVVDLKTTVAALSEKFALRAEVEAIRTEVREIRSRQDQRTPIVDAMVDYLRAHGYANK